MENRVKTEQKIEKEMLELNQQFGEFLHTKGIVAKFKIAFGNIKESTHKQREADRADFEAVKAQSEEDNKEFVEFLHTKGVKAKYNLIVNNIKNGAKAASGDIAAQIAKVNAHTQEAIARANAYGNLYNSKAALGTYTAASLADEFNAFLKAKGLDGKYTVSITEEE